MRKLGVLIIAQALFLSGCSCFTSAQKKTPACVVVNQIIDCTAPDAQEIIKGLYPLVEFLLNGANGDARWEEYLIALESLGIKAVACTAQAVIDNMAAVAASMPDAPDLPEQLKMSRESGRDRLARAQVRFADWKGKRLPAGTEIKLK